MELTPRLKTVYDMLGEGELIIDVGTDHAYLPIKLLSDGKYKYSFMTDIAPGPLDSARANAESCGIANCALYLSDGFDDVPEPQSAFSFAICGMGADMIASILERAPAWVMRTECAVLQPMTKEEHLREFLWKSGCEIASERAASEGEHIYTVMSVRYTGEKTTYTQSELFLGKRESRVASPDMARKLERFYGRRRAIRHEIAKSGGDASLQDALVHAAVEEILDLREKLK